MFCPQPCSTDSRKIIMIYHVWFGYNMTNHTLFSVWAMDFFLLSDMLLQLHITNSYSLQNALQYQWFRHYLLLHVICYFSKNYYLSYRHLLERSEITSIAEKMPCLEKSWQMGTNLTLQLPGVGIPKHIIVGLFIWKMCYQKQNKLWKASEKKIRRLADF